MPENAPFDLAGTQPRPPSALGGLLLDALMRDTTLAMAVVDADGTMAMMSPALQTLVGAEFTPVDAHRIPGHFNVRSVDGDRLLSPEEEPLNRALAGASFRDEVVSLRREDGSWLFLRCSGSPLRDEDGRSLGGIVLFDDVTSEYVATREQDRLRDRLVETFNHQLRTPLTSLVGHAEILEELATEDVQMPRQARRSLAAVFQATARLRELAEAVSELVDLEVAGRIDRAPVDVVPLVEQLVLRARTQAPDGVSVCLLAPESLVAALDAAQVSRAVDAVMCNAMAHAPCGTAVAVRLWRSEHEVVVEVSDQGPGIEERERERLVRPFERGDVTLSSPSGRGLGLAMTRAVASAHGGRLALLANEPRGLRAMIRLRTA